MREYPTADVVRVLRDLGLRKAIKGNGTDHQIWITPNALKVQPRLCKKTVEHVSLHILGTHLERIGVCKRQDFIKKVKGGRNG